MDISKAYDDYLLSVQSGWSEDEALEHACDCWNVNRDDLLNYIKHGLL